MASPAEQQRSETSVIGAVIDVLDAGQRVVIDRIELASVEARAALGGAFASLALVLFGLAFLLVGWVAGNIVAVLLLEQSWTRIQALALVASVNLLVGAVALLLARRHGPPTSSRDSTQPGRAPVAANGGTNA